MKTENDDYLLKFSAGQARWPKGSARGGQWKPGGGKGGSGGGGGGGGSEREANMHTARLAAQAYTENGKFSFIDRNGKIHTTETVGRAIYNTLKSKIGGRKAAEKTPSNPEASKPSSPAGPTTSKPDAGIMNKPDLELAQKAAKLGDGFNFAFIGKDGEVYQTRGLAGKLMPNLKAKLAVAGYQKGEDDIYRPR